jgi:hypothetical protein
MCASNFGERQLTVLDSTRLKACTAADAIAHRVGAGAKASAARIEGILFQPEPAGGYVM